MDRQPGGKSRLPSHETLVQRCLKTDISRAINTKTGTARVAALSQKMEAPVPCIPMNFQLEIGINLQSMGQNPFLFRYIKDRGLKYQDTAKV